MGDSGFDIDMNWSSTMEGKDEIFKLKKRFGDFKNSLFFSIFIYLYAIIATRTSMLLLIQIQMICIIIYEKKINIRLFHFPKNVYLNFIRH